MESGMLDTFDMEPLKGNLPRMRKGLSKCYSGKSRSFVCMDEVRCLEDLKKQHPPTKKKKNKHYTDMQNMQMQPSPCRRISSTNNCLSAIVGV